MGSQTVESLIAGGQATAAPPLGPALGPLGVNIGEVVAEINKQTADFKGMQVPVKVEIDTDTKQFTITVGTPPASQLILQEAKIEKGSGRPQADLVADLKIEQIIKISKMKDSALLGADRKAKVKEIIGTCSSMGVMVEGKPANETMQDIEKGKFEEQIRTEKTELSAEELKTLEEERKKLQEDLAKKRAEYEKTAKEILEQMKGKTRSEIKKRMQEESLPDVIIEEVLPEEEGTGGADKKTEAATAEKKE